MNIQENQKIGYLTILYKDKELSKQKHRTYWKCQCDCGNIKSYRNDYLISGRAKACGCVLSQIDHSGGDLSGQRFSKLLVLNINFPISKLKGRIYYNCLCDCGNQIILRGSQLKDGSARSCGCIKSYKELEIIDILNKFSINYKKEYQFINLKGCGNHPLRFDFAIFNNKNDLLCLLEYQGTQHKDKSSSWHTDTLIAHDKRKKEYCKLNHIDLYELTNKDNLEERIVKILNNYGYRLC